MRAVTDARTGPFWRQDSAFLSLALKQRFQRRRSLLESSNTFKER